MYLRWTAHLATEEEQEEFEKIVRNSRIVLDRLDEIIQEDIDLLNREKVSTDGFANPNWPYLQAHHLGRIKALVDIKKLTELKKE